MASGGTWINSDENLKTNIQELSSGLEIVQQLSPRTYEYRTEEYPWLRLNYGQQYGLLAQDLEQVIPSAVRNINIPVKDDTGENTGDSLMTKAINSEQLISVLVKAVQEQQSQIQSLQEQINGCCSAQSSPDAQGMQTGGTPQHQQSVTLTNTDKPMLGFASPNPNKGEVAVDYYIPENTAGVSEVLFTDALGRPVQTVRITNKGNGRLNIDTANLAAGQYQYTLIVDGEIIATRKMIRE